METEYEERAADWFDERLRRQRLYDHAVVAISILSLIVSLIAILIVVMLK